MTRARLALAQLLALSSVAGLSLANVAGCADSHGLDHDAGPVSTTDSGLEWDAAIGRDAGRDAGWIDIDAGPRGSCDAEDAHAMTCPEVLCDGPGTWHWNGDSCFWIDCGACEGTDCARSFSSEGECLAAHASCEPSLCRSTGGTWMWWAEECQPYRCGLPVPAECLVGRPVCDCGPGRMFDPDAGCVATDCGDPPPRTREQLCTDTGGSWEAICCDTTCGQLCPLPCASLACNCGPGRVMDDVRGCIESASCHEASLGESCLGEVRCEGSTICCDRCGGAGCSGNPTCAAPVCDADPHTDSCGNRDDVP